MFNENDDMNEINNLNNHIAPNGQNFIVLPFPAYTALTHWAEENNINLSFTLYNAGDAFATMGIPPMTDYVPAGHLSKALEYAMENHLKTLLFDGISYEEMYNLVDQAWTYYHPIRLK